MADKMSIDKTQHAPNDHRHLQHQQLHEDSDDSLGSSPDGGQATPAASVSNVAVSLAPQDGQQPKRKGGRKPVSTYHFSTQSSLDLQTLQCVL
jgi:hypothetical protein